MSTVTAESSTTHTTRLQSERVPIGDFPHTVNWGNPRVAAILEAAAHCFSQRGFTATTLADIGRELGLRKSIVHYYFTSKATLVQEVQSFAYGRYLQVIRAALAGAGLTIGDNSELALSAQEPGAMARGLHSLWNSLRQNSSIRGLNLELWSEGRRNEELSSRAEKLEAEAHALVRDHYLGHTKISVEDADDLATLTLAVLDGLNVREEREGNTERTSRAFAKFVQILDKCASSAG